MYVEVLQELWRREVEERMRNATQRAVLQALGVRLKGDPPLLASEVLAGALTTALPAEVRRPSGAAAAAMQDAWDTL